MAEHGLRRWIIVFTVITATVIELIDTSIVNVALSDMSGNLGATLEDVAWVVTAYAIANVIVIPITGFLSTLIGRKRYYVSSIILFTVASLFCGHASNIWELVIFRFIQGLGGGALLSTSQSILFETFEERERGMAGGIFALGVIFGPTIGPTLGGWIIEHYSWPWIFYVNLPIGLLATGLTLGFIHDHSESVRRKVTIDWPGLGLLAVGLGSLQIVLERGQTEDWFETHYITVLTALSVVCLSTFVYWELHVDNPVVNLRVLKSRSLAVAALLTFVIGFGLFGSTFIVPIYTQRILGLTALATGLVMMPGAIMSMIVAPTSGRMIQAGFPPRVLVMSGFAILTMFSLWLSGINSTMGQDDFFWPLIVRGIGIATLSVPLTTLAVAGLRGRDLAQGIALNNMMRQLGGSFGIALINTYLVRRTYANRSALLSHLSEYDAPVRERLSLLTSAFRGVGSTALQAKTQALGVIEGTLQIQSAVISYGDTFRVLAIFFVVCVPLVLLLRVPKKATPVVTDAH